MRQMLARRASAFASTCSSQTRLSQNAMRHLHYTAPQLRPAPGVGAADLSITKPIPMTHEMITNVKNTPYFQDNQFFQSESTQFIDLHDPATNNLVTRVPQSTDEELKAVVESAKRAFPAWSSTSIMLRQQIMFKLTQLIRENWDRLAANITLEQGKTFAGR